jgi:hypothetical protein
MDAAEPQPDTPQPKLRWYQYSLRTLLVSVGVFCFLLGMNTRPHSRSTVTRVSEYGDVAVEFTVLCYDYGWPWVCKTKDSLWGLTDDYYWAGFVGDIAVGLGILVAVNVALEAALRAGWRRSK